MKISKIIQITYAIFFCFILQAEANNIKVSSNFQQQIIDLSPNTDLTKLSDILTLLNIKHEFNINSIAGCFNEFRRSRFQERWDLKERDISFDTRNKILNIMHQLNLFKEITPINKQFQQALILGATGPIIKNRLEHLGKQWQDNNLRFDTIYFLGSQRPLNINRDYNIDILNGILQYILDTTLVNNDDLANIKKLLANKDSFYAEKLELSKSITTKHDSLSIFAKYLSHENATETDAATVMSKIANIPDEMTKMDKFFVTAPNIVHADNTITRANTRDTLEYWLKSYDIKTNSVIAVSNQPYTVYQLEVLRHTLKPVIEQIEITATETLSYNTTKIELYLDTIALFLHNHLQQ